MLEVFVLVKKKRSILMQFACAVVFMLALITLFFSCFIQFLIIAAVVLACIWYLMQFQTNLEYEYSYFDGEVRFAKIMNKSYRKTLRSYSMDEVIAIAPSGDRSVYRYEMNSKIKCKNYTSGYAGEPYYVMVVHAQGIGDLMIKFQPDEEYLDAVCMKYGQKVVRRPPEKKEEQE